MKSKLGDNRLLVRVAMGLLIIILSLVPLGFVSGLVQERGNLYRSVSERMTQEWSGAQQLSGAILAIPYDYKAYISERVQNNKTGEVKHVRRPIIKKKYLFVLPKTLDMKSVLKTEKLSRGIYTVPIYNSTNEISGRFEWPDLTVLDHKPETFYWERAVVFFMTSSAKGIQAGAKFNWNENDLALSPGLGLQNKHPNFGGVHARVNLTDDFKTSPAAFSLAMNLRGSRSFSFAPTGAETKVLLSADWNTPSFQGEILPTTRDITSHTFDAEWSITHLSRSYEQIKTVEIGQHDDFLRQIQSFNIGADLFDSVNLYTLLTRTVKYGVMFVSLTFFSIFVIEFATGARMHWLQHLIVGAALSMFYLCVLAFSEHISFGYSYAIGMGLISFIIGVYAWVAMGQFKYGLALSGILLALYFILYSILQMGDYALVIGTLLLLVFLVLGMYVTRNMSQPLRGDHSHPTNI